MEAVMKTVLFALLFLSPTWLCAIVGPAGGISSGQATTLGDARYLKLDTSNDPLTGELAGTSSVFTSSVTAARLVLTAPLSGITWADGSVSTTAPAGAAAISGLTVNTVPKASAANAIANSNISDSGTTVTIANSKVIVSSVVAANNAILELNNAGSRGVMINATEIWQKLNTEVLSIQPRSGYGNTLINNLSGNVGIGVSSPPEKLTVGGTVLSSTTAPALYAKATASGNVAYMYLDGYKTSGDLNYLIMSNNGDSVAAIVNGTDGSADSGFLTFNTQPAGGSNTERMRITSTGRTGLFTNNPSYGLHVASHAYVSGRAGIGLAPHATSVFRTGWASSGASPTILSAIIETDSDADGLGIYQNDGKGARIVFGSPSSAAASYISVKSSNTVAGRYMRLSGGTGADELTLTGGFLGISTTAPSGLLTVQANSSIGPANYTLLVSSQNATRVFGIHGNGNWSIRGATPSLGTCANGSLTADSSATLGEVTFSGTNTSCEVVFGSTFDATPVCFLTVHSAGLTGAQINAESTTGFTFIPQTGTYAVGDGVHYFCPGMH